MVATADRFLIVESNGSGWTLIASAVERVLAREAWEGPAPWSLPGIAPSPDDEGTRTRVLLGREPTPFALLAQGHIALVDADPDWLQPLPYLVARAMSQGVVSGLLLRPDRVPFRARRARALAKPLNGDSCLVR
jgi:hypothetical protein